MKITRKLVLLLSLPLLTAAQSNNLPTSRPVFVEKRAAQPDPVDHGYRYRRLLGLPNILGGDSPPGSNSTTTSSSSTSSSSGSSTSTSGSSTTTTTSGSSSTTSSSSTTTTTTSSSSSPTTDTNQVTSYTNSDGSLAIQTITRVIVYQPSDSATASAGNSTAGNTNSGSSNNNSISQSTIIGLSVAGGIAVIGIVAFIIWKFTRKRFAGLDDFEDAIKWPEYKNNGDEDMTMGPLPTRATGGAGVETSAYAPSEADYDAHSVAGGSTSELVPAVTYASAPYSQPMPAQQYYDDAAYGGHVQPGGYYDPYGGVQQGAPGYVPGRTTSPGPQRSLTLASSDQTHGAENLYRQPTRGGAMSPPQRGPSMNTQGMPVDDAGSVYTTARSRSPGPMQALGGEMGERGQHLGLANP